MGRQSLFLSSSTILLIYTLKRATPSSPSSSFDNGVILPNSTDSVFCLHPPIPSESFLKENPWASSSSFWGGQCALGKRQSPVELPRQGNLPLSHLPPSSPSDSSSPTSLPPPPLLFRLFSSSARAILLGNEGGRAITLEVGRGCGDEEEEQPTVEGGGLNGKYVFFRGYFRWRSEHTKSATVFPLEVQLLLYRSDFPGPKEAVEAALKHMRNETDTNISLSNAPLAGLSTLYQTSNDNNPRLDSIAEAVSAIAAAGSGSKIRLPEPPPLSNFLPRGRDSFYRYLGSLTRPPCAEGVAWTVFKEPQSASLKQLAKLKSILTDKGAGNSRPLQPLNGRTIFEMDPQEDQDREKKSTDEGEEDKTRSSGRRGNNSSFRFASLASVAAMFFKTL